MVSLNIELLTEPEAIKRISSWLKTFRTESGLTQREAAKEINVTNNTWSRWELGDSVPNGIALLHIEQRAREWGLIDD